MPILRIYLFLWQAFDTVEQLAENTLAAIQGLKGVDSSQIEAVRKNIQSIKTQIKDLKSDTE